MGYTVKVNANPDNPRKDDLIARFTYSKRWDFVYYLKYFQIQLIEAKSGNILATGSFNAETEFHTYARESAVKGAFDEIRKQKRY